MTADHRVKGGEKLNKNLDYTSKLKKIWKIKATVMPIISGALGTVPKDLEKRIDEFKIIVRIEITQTTAS